MSTTRENSAEETKPAAGNGFAHLNWSSIPVERIAEGIERQMLVGENMMICRFLVQCGPSPNSGAGDESDAQQNRCRWNEVRK